MPLPFHCLLTGLVACAHLATAEPPASFLVRTWQSEDGLPGNVVRAVRQTPAGYLLVATAEGLVRFDGVRFSSFDGEPDATLARLPARALYPLPDGTVWISTTRGGLLRWNGRRLISLLPETGAPVPVSQAKPVTHVASDGSGGAYIVRTPELWHAAHGAAPEPMAWTPQIEALVQADLSRWTERGGPVLGGTLHLRDHRERSWKITPNGNLAVTESGDAAESALVAMPKPSNRINGLHEDREGNVWVATGGGLVRISERRVKVLTAEDGLRDRSALAVLEDRSGAWWIGSRSEGVDRLEGGRVTHFDVGTGRPISALCEDHTGVLWAATHDGSVFRFDDHTFISVLTATEGVTKVLAIVEDARGGLWFGGGTGLARLESGRLTHFGPEAGLTAPEVTALAIDATGRLVAGTSVGTIFRQKGERFERLGPEEGPPRPISAILPEAEGALWVSSFGGGLLHWRDGKFTRFGASEGLPELRLTALLADDAGALWLGSLSGIFRVEKADLAAVDRGEQKAANWLQLDRSDGLLSRECTGLFQPSAWRARDGQLWFPTLDGVARIRPASFVLNPVPPPVVIEQTRANGVPLAPNRRCGPGRSRLEFRFTGLSFTAPEKVKFRVRLDGLEDDWRDGGMQRTAVYEAVPPGRYRFHVTAANADGVWNETGATVAIEVLPHYWETLWFRASVALLAMAVAAGVGSLLARARLRGRLLRMEAQTAREAERARIAQDLHDDLGASLTEISMLAHLAAEEDPAASKSALPEIATKTQALVGALDEIVWAVNPRHDTLASLVDYLAASTAEFLETAGIALRLDIPRKLPPLPLNAAERHGLYLAVREAVNNAVKHSAAREVRLCVKLDAAHLHLAIEDNGRGISSLPAESDEGLRSLRHRLAAVGGHCEIESAPGVGTKVYFRLPLGGSGEVSSEQ